MAQIIISFLTGVLGPIAVLFIKNWLEKKKKIDPLTEAIDNANIIHDELDQILESNNADRIWIAQFHNGGHYYPTGKSIQKFSVVYELVRQTKDTVRAGLQNIPVSLFSKALGEVSNTDFLGITDYKDETNATYGLKYIAEETHAKSTYLMAMRSFDDKLIGLLCLEFTKSSRALTKDQIIELRIEATKLASALGTHLKVK
jgi:hypothetical protein